MNMVGFNDSQGRVIYINTYKIEAIAGTTDGEYTLIYTRGPGNFYTVRGSVDETLEKLMPEPRCDRKHCPTRDNSRVKSVEKKMYSADLKETTKARRSGLPYPMMDIDDLMIFKLEDN